jgi:hypothetical protein
MSTPISSPKKSHFHPFQIFFQSFRDIDSTTITFLKNKLHCHKHAKRLGKKNNSACYMLVSKIMNKYRFTQAPCEIRFLDVEKIVHCSFCKKLNIQFAHIDPKEIKQEEILKLTSAANEQVSIRQTYSQTLPNLRAFLSCTD